MGRKLTIKELAAATGQKDATVRQHILRNRVKKDKAGFIDVDTDFNKVYINDVTNGGGLHNPIAKIVTVKAIKGVTNGEAKEKPVLKEASESDKFFQNMERRKKMAEVEVQERNAELKKYELEKKAGNLLPVNIVSNILIINCHSIVKAFEAELDNINSVYVERMGGTRQDIADITAKQRKSLDLAMKRAQDSAMHEIDIEIEKYQESRGVGERDR